MTNDRRWVKSLPCHHNLPRELVVLAAERLVAAGVPPAREQIDVMSPYSAQEVICMNERKSVREGESDG